MTQSDEEMAGIRQALLDCEEEERGLRCRLEVVLATQRDLRRKLQHLEGRGMPPDGGAATPPGLVRELS